MRSNENIKNVANAILLALALVPIVVSPARAQTPSGASLSAPDQAVIQPAIDGIFDAFKTHPLVGLSDKHGLAQEMEFYEALIRDPRFARDVGNVVVEFGGAARQDVIDRYTSGELVPYAELRQVWTDTVGWLPTVQHLGYAHFFAQVRETNLTLPPQERIRVWLGEPPIIWARIQTRDEYLAFGDRDGHAASVIIQNILATNKKALVIYGAQHFRRTSAEEEGLRTQWAETDPQNARPASPGLLGLVEAEKPGVFFVVQVYEGFDDQACTTRFEQEMQNWPMPALAMPVRGTVLESAMSRCPATIRSLYPPAMPQALQDLLRSEANNVLYRGDAILFLGSASSFTMSPMFPDLYLDDEYRQEISRHSEVIFGTPLPPDYGRDVPVTPRPFD